MGALSPGANPVHPDPSPVADAQRPAARGPGHRASYRLARCEVRLRSDAPAFAERFDELLGDTRRERAGERAASVPGDPALDADVTAADSGLELRVRGPGFEDPAPLLELARELYRDRDEVLEPGAILPLPESGAAVRVQGTTRAASLIGNLVVGAALRAQPGIVALHAASVELDGEMLLFLGPKARGKTTTALALAAHGLPLGSDELTAIDAATGTVYPIPRALSIRPGPRSAALRLDEVDVREERWPDGGLRLRVRASELFPLAGPRPLRAIVFLDAFGKRPALRALRSSAGLLRELGPHPASLAHLAPVRRTFALASVLARGRVLRLTPGAPDETARFLLRELRTA